MTHLDVFEAATLEENKNRIDKLLPNTQPLWGKMDVAQMLAHVNVTYQLAKGDLIVNVHPMVRFILKTFIKKTIVGNKPYAKNGKTAPYFLVADERNFEQEKKLLLDHMKWVYEKGAPFFEDKSSASLGKLTAKEWSQMFQKHLDHHLKQFGV